MTDYQIDQLANKAARLAHPVFVSNGWKYAFASADGGIPTEENLYSTVGHLIKNMERDPTMLSIGTGRFHVTRDYKDDGGGLSVFLELGHSYDEDVMKDYEVRRKESLIEYYEGRIKDCEQEIQERYKQLYGD